MTRNEFLKSLVGASAVPAVQRTGLRNLVLILSDDHNHRMLGVAGHPWLKTPHLDRLARGGVLFQNAFATTSLCSPSRASILTGQYAHAHGVLDNTATLPPDAPIFPAALRRSGYRTAFIGKWHLSGEADDPWPGFDRWVSFPGQGVYSDPVLNVDGARVRVGGYLTDILTAEALRFIREESQPFCLVLSHKAVHSFCEPAPRHRDLYSQDPIPYPASMADTDENYRGKPDWVRRQRRSWHGVDGMYDGGISFDRHYRDYCRTLMALDDSVGQVLDQLEAQRLLGSTLVLYASDNGFQFGEHGLIDKRAMYEPSIRIPLIAHCPDLFAGGRREDGLALNLDLAPTLLDAAGLEPPDDVHGSSLLRLLRGDPEWRTDFLYEYFWEREFPQTPTVLGLRTRRYSYMRYQGIWDVNELYDLRDDPDQMRNLLADARVTTQAGSVFAQIRDPALRSLIAQLREEMFDILEETEGLPEPTWGA